MTQFTRGPNPIWFMSNLTGSPLDDTYFAFFLTNDLPYIPQAVFQDPNGLVPWSDPIEFQPSSGLPNNLYGDSTLTYRIEVRQGQDQTSPLIWPVQNYQFGSGSGGGVVTNMLTVAENQITNPQFADISFTSPYTRTEVAPGTYTVNVGPGWDLVLTGTGTTILTQGTNPGDSVLQGNPAYYLTINNSGWTSAQLIQQFSNNGAIFSGGAVAVAFSANATSAAETVTVAYSPSMGTATNIFSASIPTGSMLPYSGAIDIPDSTSTDTDGTAYVNIVFNLPGTGIVSLSNIQITGQSLPLSSTFDVDTDTPIYQEESYERMVDHEFNVYKPWLFEKPIPNYLVGWDFPLNPAQFLGPTIAAQATGANKSFYAWDQTIVFQKSSSSCHISRDIAGSFTINNDINGNQGAVIQYLPQQVARRMLNQPMAVNVYGLFLTGLKLTVSLWYTTDVSLPNMASGTNNSLVATLDANGKPATFHGSWTEVARKNKQDATFTGSGPTSVDFTDYSFNGWNIGDSSISNSVTFFAIVIGTAAITSTAGGEVDINSVNLVNGNIAPKPSPQTPDEVLRECQYYYEKSYNVNVIPGIADLHSSLSKPMLGRVVGGDTVLSPMPFSVEYKQAKRVLIPTFGIYSASVGTLGSVSGQIWSNAYNTNASAEIVVGTTWGPTYGQYGVLWLPLAGVGSFGATGSNVAPPVASIVFQYTVDARLGMV